LRPKPPPQAKGADGEEMVREGSWSAAGTR
jgi:hypothetical protein